MTSGVRSKATTIATITEVTTLSRLPTMMDRNPVWIFHLKILIVVLQEDMAAKTVVTPASFLLSSAKYPERHRPKKILSTWPAGRCTAQRDISHARRAGVPVRTRSRFEYIIQGLPNCLCLWKVVEAEALTKTLPNLMSTSLLLMETKAKCCG